MRKDKPDKQIFSRNTIVLSYYRNLLYRELKESKCPEIKTCMKRWLSDFFTTLRRISLETHPF